MCLAQLETGLENSKVHLGHLGVTHGTWKDIKYDCGRLRGFFFPSPRPSASFSWDQPRRRNTFVTLMKFCKGIGPGGRQLCNGVLRDLGDCMGNEHILKTHKQAPEAMKHCVWVMLMGDAPQAFASLLILYPQHLIFVIIILLGLLNF